jgi:predicted RNA binding protein YcfA (HicA-like mRNA interferase family)
MNRRELRRRLLQWPKPGEFTGIDRLLSLSGFELSGVRGSHHVYRNEAGQHISVPGRLVLSTTQEALIRPAR